MFATVNKLSILLFPTCGIHYQDVVNCAVAGLNIRQSAVKLGIAESNLRKVIKEQGMGHWFKYHYPKPKPVKKKKPNRLNITKRRLLYYARQGYTIKDTASAMKAGYKATRRAINYFGVRDLFPNQGAGRWIAERGYCGE